MEICGGIVILVNSTSTILTMIVINGLKPLEVVRLLPYQIILHLVLTLEICGGKVILDH